MLCCFLFFFSFFNFFLIRMPIAFTYNESAGTATISVPLAIPSLLNLLVRGSSLLCNAA